MEQIENDRKKVLDLINPIIEKHDEYETNILFLEKHLEIIKLFILTTNDFKYKVYSES